MDKKTTIENLVNEAHEKGGFTGVWLYSEHGEIISKGAVGFRSEENTLPMREDPVFDIASVSKQFMSASSTRLWTRSLWRTANCPPGSGRKTAARGCGNCSRWAETSSASSDTLSNLYSATAA